MLEYHDPLLSAHALAWLLRHALQRQHGPSLLLTLDRSDAQAFCDDLFDLTAPDEDAEPSPVPPRWARPALPPRRNP